MGWSYGIVNGKEVGYSVPDVCNHPECDVEIDRGLSYACGDMPGSGLGCDGFFCGKHLNFTGIKDPSQVCDACLKELLAAKREEGCACETLDDSEHTEECPLYRADLEDG
jgi:hypothetical protein